MMLDVRLYLAQRISALIMVPLVFAHLGVMIYAIQGGLSAEEILGRTQGSVAWTLFYGSFVAAASLHGAIGLRVIVHETLGLRGVGLSIMTCGVFGVFFWMGARAVTAVTMVCQELEYGNTVPVPWDSPGGTTTTGDAVGSVAGSVVVQPCQSLPRSIGTNPVRDVGSAVAVRHNSGGIRSMALGCSLANYTPQ